MTPYHVTGPARRDLFDTWSCIAEQAGFDRADHVIADLHAAMDKAAEMPGLGHRRMDLADESLRFLRAYSYLIVDRPDMTPLQVVRVLHSARDVRAILAEEMGADDAEPDGAV